MGISDLLNSALSGSGSGGKDEWYPCPSCKTKINLKMERCTKCGVRIASMFRRKCPRCQSLNELKIKNCVKCNYNFEAEEERRAKDKYQCPICNYTTDAYLTRCPVCNTRFV